MSLRLRPRASVALADDASIFDQLRPYIDKLVLSEKGVCLITIAVGALMKMSHAKPFDVVVPGRPTRHGGDIIQEPDTVRHVPENAGFDVLLYTIELPINVRQAEDFWNWLKGAVPQAGQLASSVLPLGGLLGQVIGGLMPSFDTSTVSSNEPFKVRIYLSDVLIVAGSAGFGLSSAGSLLGKV